MYLLRLLAVAALALLLAASNVEASYGKHSFGKGPKSFFKAGKIPDPKSFFDGFKKIFKRPGKKSMDTDSDDEPETGEDTLGVDAPDEPDSETDCFCTAEFAPVCCDGVEYSNPCQAECAGLMPDMCTEGECEDDGVTSVPLPVYGKF